MITLVSLAGPPSGPGTAALPACPPALAQAFCALVAEGGPQGEIAPLAPGATPETEDEETKAPADTDDLAPEDGQVADATALVIAGLPPVPAPMPVPGGNDGASRVTLGLRDSGNLAPAIGNPTPPMAAAPAEPHHPAVQKTTRQDLVAPAPPQPESEGFDAPARAVAQTDRPDQPGGSAEGATRFRLSEATHQSADAGTEGLPPPVPTDPDLSAVGPAPAEPKARDSAAPAPHSQAAGHLVKTLTADHIQLVTKAGHSELTLAPEELGRVRFDIRQHGDLLTVALRAENPETLELLKRHANDLRQELAAAGFGSATLDFGNGGEAWQGPASSALAPPPEPSEPLTLLTPPHPAAPTQVVGDGLDIRL